MNTVRHFQRDGYHVVDWPGRTDVSLEALWEHFPELMLGRYLVNTSLDSGHWIPTPQALVEGWRIIGTFAHSPAIQRIEQIPHCWYDEWLVFERPVEIAAYETMVNFAGFSPTDFSWDEKREWFWQQIVLLQPLHVLGQNDTLYWVSRDEKLVSQVLESELCRGVMQCPA